MRLRPAEIDQHAIAHELGDVSLEAGHLRCDRLAVGGKDLPQILGIEAHRKGSRTDEVDEHHRQMTALGGPIFSRRSRSASLR
jgi:hypothetical protein